MCSLPIHIKYVQLESNMNCLKICGFVFALIAALSSADAATQVLHAGGHTLIQTDNSQYIRKN
ncbi:daisho2 [Drosophila sulfurigaster albostrigata]|nr:daisho2 [Drosophila sulfurigaster albostrigata]